MRITNPLCYLFCIVFCITSCRPEGTVVRIDKASFTAEDQVKIGLALSRQVTQNPNQYPAYTRDEYPEPYAYLDLLFETMVNTPAVENRSNFPWRINILKDSQSMTAFSMPGGAIYITDGFLKLLNNEAQLFAVLSNEMYNSDQGAVMSLLQDNFSGLTLGDILFNNPVDELDDMIATLQFQPLTTEDTRFADRFSVDVICPFQYAPDALATVFEMELSDTNFPLEWTNIRPTYEGRVANIRSTGLDCGGGSKLEAERYQNSLIRHLEL